MAGKHVLGNGMCMDACAGQFWGLFSGEPVKATSATSATPPRPEELDSSEIGRLGRHYLLF